MLLARTWCSCRKVSNRSQRAISYKLSECHTEYFFSVRNALLLDIVGNRTMQSTIVNGTVQGIVEATGAHSSSWSQHLMNAVHTILNDLITTVKHFITELPQHAVMFMHHVPGLLLAAFIAFLSAAKNIIGHMILQIVSQLIGTAIIGIVLFRYRHKLKEVIASVVVSAGSMVPEDWVDEEAIIDLVEEAAGIDTPDVSEDEGEKGTAKPNSIVANQSANTAEETTPLLGRENEEDSKLKTRVTKRVHVKRKVPVRAAAAN